MACVDPAATAIEQPCSTVADRHGDGRRSTADALHAAPTATNGLVAHAAPGRAPAPAGLVGPTWPLESATATGVVAAGERAPTLTFDGTTVAVDTGCNTGSGGYTVAGDADHVRADRHDAACRAPTRPATIETTILAVLDRHGDARHRRRRGADADERRHTALAATGHADGRLPTTTAAP